MKKFKPWEDLTFTDDYMFKLLMERKRICKGTLNAFLDWNIRSITYFATEKPLKAGYAAKGVRLDVYLHDETSRVYDVEMQVLKKKEKPDVDAMMTLAKRARFYLSELDTRALERSGLYADLRPTIVIFFCPFRLFDGRRAVYTFPRICQEDPCLTLPDETALIFISSKNARSGLSPRACALLDYMNGKITKEPLIAQIEESMRTIKRHETERKIYMTYIMKMREERQDAFTEGKAEGKAEGMNLVMRIVEQLQKKVPYQTIATDTHTTLEQVVEIANKFKMAY
ncbi:MAG: Rpn family recombination-promoting nuclease/putative transposase [Selenomonadaceae bacterium]|nr:Rpn family recombination-promoting nuclease/putative transposase [Selenomonadaceae bacterium]